ncbi:DNA methyltransferase [Mycoplasma corogypsi]|uniref:DNA methyltransferase n=1 Tax=Mycoplasma corogypsi TaxID=2106 RepID=UPI00387355C0
MDPPYNTESAVTDGNSVADDKENISNSKFIYRDKFSRNGWLNMLQERLILARQLLKEDGVIFVSIDDSEQAYLKVLMDEIFGEKNFAVCIPYISNLKGRQANTNFALTHEYILCYSNGDNFKFKELEDIYISKLMPQIYKEIFKDAKGFFKLQNKLENTNSKFNSKQEVTCITLYTYIKIKMNIKLML